MVLELAFIDGSEELFIAEENKIRQVSLPLFGITNSFIQAAKAHAVMESNPLRENSIMNIHRIFSTAYHSILGDKVEKYNYSYLPFIRNVNEWAEINKSNKAKWIPIYYYMAEFAALINAVSSWLPVKSAADSATPLERFRRNGNADVHECFEHICTGQELESTYDYAYSMEVNLEEMLNFYSRLTSMDHDAFESFLEQEYSYEIFESRTSEITISKRLIKNGEGIDAVDFFRTEDLLALAWAEIMYALNNEKYAGFCAECGKLFHLNRPYTAKTCSLQCYSRFYRKEFKDPEGRYTDGERGFKDKMAENRRQKRHETKILQV